MSSSSRSRRTGPDCLAVYGIAREVHAATGAALSPPPWLDDPGTQGEVAGAEVVVEASDLCPRFTARLFEDVIIAPSPPWLKARLMAAGQRPISNVVDITNYVMLATGQPCTRSTSTAWPEDGSWCAARGPARR
jgi:phenylalanyl-tRNA synthetase beta chain